MTCCDLIILQFIAHLLADFTFQKESWVRHKRRYAFESKILYWHVLVVFLMSFLLSFHWNFVLFSMAIALSHLFIDGFRNQGKWGRYGFFIDQAIHLVIIFSLTMFYNKLFSLSPYLDMPVTSHQLLIISIYVFCTKPANVLIKEILKAYKIKLLDDAGDDLLNAGKLIGIAERVLTVSLLLFNQYEAVGFIIAAKSILRFEGTKTSKTEYVLVGTLLSFGIAILATMSTSLIKL